MAEEHRCQAPPEGHRLCANNCGLFGSAATLNLCSSCYRDYCLKEQQQQQQQLTSSSSFASLKPYLPSPVLPISSNSSSEPSLELPEVVKLTGGEEKQANRCSVCRKRVVLTGFKCRCGINFCGTHRYPENHACTFDFKKLGREEIARANPLVIADKLRRI